MWTLSVKCISQFHGHASFEAHPLPGEQERQHPRPRRGVRSTHIFFLLAIPRSSRHQNSDVNARINNFYVVSADVAILTVPGTSAQYVIDHGYVYLRVPSAAAQAINIVL